MASKMKIGKTFVSAILAGMAISFGGVVFLSLENKVLGSLFFTVGLFMVCTFGLNLFTGKVCYFFQNDLAFRLNLIVIWLGNLVGTLIVGNMVRLSRIAGIAERADSMCAVKTGDSMVSLFILGILCDIFIYVGVESYRSNPHETGKYLGLFFGVMVFILCGYEHCVADMFYFTVADAWSAQAVVCLLVITAGNAAGGVFFPLVRGFLAKE